MAYYFDRHTTIWKFLIGTVKEQFFIHASTSKVFNALTMPRQITRWFFSKATIPRRKGATYHFIYPDGQEQSGKILDYARGKRFSIEWATILERKIPRTHQGDLYNEAEGHGYNSERQAHGLQERSRLDGEVCRNPCRMGITS